MLKLRGKIMKKIFVLLALAFVLVSCDNGNMETPTTEPNPFVGTWENENGRWVFTETTVIVYYSNGDVYWSGTYTYDDSNITFTYEYRVPELETEDNPNPFVRTFIFLEDGSLRIGLALISKKSN